MREKKNIMSDITWLPWKHINIRESWESEITRYYFW